MKNLVRASSLAALILLFSGCNNVFNNLNTPTKAKINETLEVVDFNSIKSISDITSVGFEWQKVDDSRINGYNFYRTDLQKDNKNLKLIKTIENRYATHYVDKDLEPNTKYAYQISARAIDGTESKSTEAYIAQTLPRIVPIDFVQAISQLPNRVKLLWRPHPDKRIEYYRIEKFNTTLNEWIHLKTVNQRLQVEYIDTGLDNNTNYKYRIKAFTFNHVESAPSPAVIGKTKALPSDPSNITATQNQVKKINISWNASQTSDIINYEIHRSSYSSLGFSKVATVNAETLNYSDKVDDNGRTYYYKILAIDKDQLVSPYNSKAVEGKTLDVPAKPVLTLAQIQGNKAILNWKAGDNRAVSYNVKKRIRLNFFEYKTINFNNINDLRFEDNDILSGVEYKYSVEANDEFGLISNKTDETSLTLPKLKSLQ